MSTSQEPQAALVSVQDQVTNNRLLDTNLGETTETESIELLMVTQQVLSRVAQYSQPVREIQQVCCHPEEIADQRNQITIFQAQAQPPPLVCDHTNYEAQLTTLRNELEVARRTPRIAGTDEDLRRELDDMTRDAPRSQRGRPEFEDAVSECAILSRMGSASSPPPTRRQRTEISRLPGLFRVGSNSVERLDCATPDDYPPHTQQVSRRAGEDEVRLQPPERDRFEADIATRPRQRRDRARGPTSFYTTPGSSFWGPRASSHRGTEYEGN